MHALVCVCVWGGWEVGGGRTLVARHPTQAAARLQVCAWLSHPLFGQLLAELAAHKHGHADTRRLGIALGHGLEELRLGLVRFVCAWRERELADQAVLSRKQLAQEHKPVLLVADGIARLGHLVTSLCVGVGV